MNKCLLTILKLNFDKNYRYYVLNQYALPRNNKNFMILNFFNEQLGEKQYSSQQKNNYV